PPVRALRPLVAVMERSAEIGLRRALGATGRHIAAHVVAESASLGILGGVLGTALGLTAVIAIALLRGWSPVIEPALLLWAPLLGLATGAAAGLYPARKATRIEPTEALRGR
ncbi:MAG: ABC transporter permease, partial [Propionibacteriaceae bacterium]|nr:ABC transporter permease [Propionibacteriaceae bacterium]